MFAQGEELYVPYYHHFIMVLVKDSLLHDTYAKAEVSDPNTHLSEPHGDQPQIWKIRHLKAHMKKKHHESLIWDIAVGSELKQDPDK